MPVTQHQQQHQQCKKKKQKNVAANILADLLMLLPYLGPFIAVTLSWLRILLIVFCWCFFVRLCFPHLVYIHCSCFILFNGCFYVPILSALFLAHNNGYSTRDDVSHFVYITIGFDRLKNEHVRVKFHSYSCTRRCCCCSFFLSLSMDLTTSFIFATDSADHEWDRIVHFFIDPKTFYECDAASSYDREFTRARESEWAQCGLVISVYTRLKYLRANQILLSSEYHYKCVYAYKIEVQFLEQQQQ